MLATRFRRALHRVGQDAVLLRGDGPSPAFPASIQPSATLPGEDAGPLGAGRRRRYLILTPAEPGMKGGDLLQSGGMRYRILTAEEQFLAGEALYTRAVAELEGECR